MRRGGACTGQGHWRPMVHLLGAHQGGCAQLEQPRVLEIADSAALPVRAQDPLSEALLMKTALGRRCDVQPPSLLVALGHITGRGLSRDLPVIDGHCERELLLIVPDDEHGVLSGILALDQSDEVDERKLHLHRKTKSTVVTVRGVGTSVPVVDQAVGPDRVLIRPSLAFFDGDRREADREVQYGWLPNPGRANQGHPTPDILKS